MPFNDLSILNDGPLAREMLEAGEIVPIDDRHHVPIKPQGLHRLDEFLVLGQPRSWRVIGEAKPVHHETAVIGIIAKVSTVRHVLLPIFGVRTQTLPISQSRKFLVPLGLQIRLTWFAHSQMKPPIKRGYL